MRQIDSDKAEAERLTQQVAQLTLDRRLQAPPDLGPYRAMLPPGRRLGRAAGLADGLVDGGGREGGACCGWFSEGALAVGGGLVT